MLFVSELIGKVRKIVIPLFRNCRKDGSLKLVNRNKKIRNSVEH